MLAVKISEDSSESIPWEEIVEEEKQYEALEQKEKEIFIRKWLKKIS